MGISLQGNVCQTFILAILTHLGGSVRTFRSRVPLLLADTASSLEDARLGAIRFGMSGVVSAKYWCDTIKVFLPLLTAVEACHRLTRLGAVTCEVIITSTTVLG